LPADKIIKKRILFVDDEPAILAGLQNLLYKDRKRWEMVFANSGDKALAEMRKQAFDVVVSDMRMPGIDGATLLNVVKDEFPATARIMLSGHAEREAIVRALPALHQLLSKPCDADTLRVAIERGCDSDPARDEKIRAAIGRVDKLPSPPDIFFDLSRVMQSATAGIDEVAALVVRDPGLAAKVLQLVNSAYFGARQKTSTIQQAVSLLGIDRLRYIALTVSVFCTAEGDVQELQALSQRTAQLAQGFLGKSAGEAFAAALLCDVGRIIFMLGMTEQYREVCAAAPPGELVVYEEQAFGVTHADVGARLLALWGLPNAIVDVVRNHHHPDLAPEPLRYTAGAIFVADALAHGIDPAKLDQGTLLRAGVLHMVPAWCAIARAS